MPAALYAAAYAAGLSADPNDPFATVRAFIAKYPRYATAYNQYAYDLWAHGEHPAALAAAERQVDLNPGAPNPHDTYAELLQWDGKFPEATAEYRRATKTPPRYPQSYSGLAEVEALQQHYPQARIYLNQAIADAWYPGQKLGIMREIAGTYVLEGDADLSKQLADIIAEAKAQNDLRTAAIVTAQTAAVYATAGDAAAAHKAIADAKAIKSPDAWEVNYYATMAHAILKHWGPANQELAAMKQKTVSDLGAQRTMVAAADGNLATAQGGPADGLKILMAADTTSFIVMNRIAEAHSALGHSAEATAWYGRINSNYALVLSDFPAVNARRRSAIAVAARK
jgi:tetratricopeptide (TPR) repeat protein